MLWSLQHQAYLPVASAGDSPEQWELLRLAEVPRAAVTELFDRREQRGCYKCSPRAVLTPCPRSGYGRWG